MNATLVRLRERLPGALSTAKVDVENGVIDGVSLLGLKSKNDREYEPAVVKEAVQRGLFSGVQVYVDHQESADDGGVREFRELVGVTGTSTFDGTLVRAPLHVVTSDPAGAKLLEMASRPELAASIGMSQDAEGRIVEREGQPDLVTELTSVTSVDVVTRPATTKSLFESHKEAQPMKLREMAGKTCSIKSADSDPDKKAVVTRGPMVEVEVEGEDYPRMVPMEMVSMDADGEETDENEDEPEEEPADADASEVDEKPTDEMDGDPEDEEKKTKESVMTQTERAELKALREQAAIRATQDAVEAVAVDLPSEVAAKMREHFDGKSATTEEVTSYVGQHVGEIVTAFAEEHAIEAPSFGPRRQETVTADAGNALREAFGTLTGHAIKGGV